MTTKSHSIVDFVKNIIAPINAIFIFSSGVVVALDMLAPRGPYLQITAYVVASLLGFIMLLEVFVPAFIVKWLNYPAKGLIHRLKSAWKSQYPLCRSSRWQLGALIVFAAIILGKISHAKAETGGIMATYFESFASFQKSYIDIKNDLTDIKDKLKNVKQEISDDPRKELINLGFKWTDDDFTKAVLTADARVVKLFADSNFTPSKATAGRVIYYALSSPNQEVVFHLTAMNLKSSYEYNALDYSPEGCGKVLLNFDEIKENFQSENSKKLLINACGGKEEVDYLREKIIQEEKLIEGRINESNRLKNEAQQAAYIAKNTEQCLNNQNTKMLLAIDGARQKFCTDQARKNLQNIKAAPQIPELRTLANKKIFLNFIK